MSYDIYEITSIFTIMHTSPSSFSFIKEILYKGTRVEVITFIKEWAKCIYGNNTGYIKKKNLKLVSSLPKSGTVTVNYLDTNSMPLSSPSIYNELSFGRHTFNALKIEGYRVLGDNSKTIVLSESQSNVTIYFTYEKITGSVTIRYIDTNTQANIIPPEIINDLPLGSYEYSYKPLNGYTIAGAEIISVNLSEEAPDATITFEYTTDIPQSINPNEVPYISMYYLEPEIEPGTVVTINYYVSDYHHTSYNYEKAANHFTVFVNMDNKTITKIVNAGDNSLILGTFYTEGEISFSIKCSDQYNRSSHELFCSFNVKSYKAPKMYTMTEDDLVKYNIKNKDQYEDMKIIPVNSSSDQSVKQQLEISSENLVPEPGTYLCVVGDDVGNGEISTLWNETIIKYASDYNKDFVLKEASDTRKGLQQLIDDTKAKGFNELVLLKGSYRIDHTEPLLIPSDFILDLNGATIKQNSFTGSSSTMISMRNAKNASLINGILEGDYFTHDYSNSSNNSEWVIGFSLDGDCKNCLVKNMEIKNIAGYGSNNGIGKINDSAYKYSHSPVIPIGSTFKLGDINRTTGDEISSDNRVTCPLMDISSFKPYDYLTVSKYLGYQGNKCGTWNFICHFYNRNKEFLNSTDGYFYRSFLIPEEAYYARITILNEVYPTDLTLNNIVVPQKCVFKNIDYKNCRAIGMAQCAMQNFLVEDCSFINCGQTLAKCAYDAEDGWDLMQDVTFRGLNFKNNPNNDFLTCAGHNFVIEDMKAGKIGFWERTNSYVVRNCNNINSATLRHDNRVKSGYNRFYNNEMGDCKVIGTEDCNWILTLKDTKIHGRATGQINTSNFLRCTIDKNRNNSFSLYNSIVGFFTNCHIHDLSSSHNMGGIYEGCFFENNTMNLQNSQLFKNCTMNNNCFGGANVCSITIENSLLTNTEINMTYWYKGAEVIIKDSIINNDKHLIKLPHYASCRPITITNNEVTIAGTNGVVYYYDDRENSINGGIDNPEPLSVIDNKFNCLSCKYVVNGLSEKAFNKLILFFSGNILSNDTLTLYNKNALTSENISITEK